MINKSKIGSLIANLIYRAQDFENRLNELALKCKKYRVYYKLFKHAQSLQCKSCDEHFKNDDFVSHTQICSMNKSEHTKSQQFSDFKFSIIQTLIKEDDQSKKPYTEYVIQVKLDNKKWMISRRYKHFCALHASLQRMYPTAEYPKSSHIFCSKTLSDIRKNGVVDGRRKILQSYVMDIASIPVIRASKKFTHFVGLTEADEEEIAPTLPRTSLEEIFDKCNIRSSNQQPLIA